MTRNKPQARSSAALTGRHALRIDGIDGRLSKLKRRRRKAFFAALSVVMVMAIWVWWRQWSAPYRALMTFLNALERGDLDTVYALTPSQERAKGIITPELVRRTYEHLLRPRWLERYRLVQVERPSPKNDGPPEIWVRSVAVQFVLHYRDAQGNTINPPLIVYVSRTPQDREWRIPFSYFVFLTAHRLIGFESHQGDTWMYRMGYRFIYLHNGFVEPLEPHLFGGVR